MTARNATSRWQRKRLCVQGAVALGLISPVFQAPAAAQDSSATQCELHVWPAAAMKILRFHATDNFSLGSPLFQPGTLDPAGKERHDAVASASTPLTTDTQVLLLKAAPLAALMHLDTYRTVIHEQPLGSLVARQPGRHAASVSQCYAELTLNDLAYTRIYANGHSLKSMIVFRDFGSGDAPLRSFGTAIDSKLTVPLKDLDVSSSVFKADVEAAFNRSLQTFSGYLARSAKK